MARFPMFEEGEKVLCFYGPLLYEAKCLKTDIEKDCIRYFIHYAGWKKSWDEWVPASRILKYNESNLQRQKEVQEAQAALQENSKKKTSVKEEYSCSSCTRTFPLQADLDQHMEWHVQWLKQEMEDNKDNIDTSFTYPCSLCSKMFLTQLEHDTHMGWHTHLEYMQSASVRLDKINILKCDFCTRGFTDKASLNIHRKKYCRKDVSNQNRLEEPFTCKTCGWGFMQESALEAHSILHQPFPHVCECGVGFYQKCDLNAHRRLLKHAKKQPLQVNQHTERKPKAIIPKPLPRKFGSILTASNQQPDTKTIHKKSIKRKLSNIALTSNENIEVKPEKQRKYECKLCERTFSSTIGYKDHMIQQHGWNFQQDLVCDICGQTFKWSKSRNEHIASEHKGARPYLCPICNKRYSQSGALQQHLLRHEGNRKFGCDACGKRFYDAATLRLHSRVHTGEKPYECDQCGKSFADPSAYKRHTIIHTGLKPYRCTECPQAFCDPSALYRHTRMHNGYKVPCTLCDKTFKSLVAVRYHIKLSHTGFKEQEKFECDHCGKKFNNKSNLKFHIVRAHILNAYDKPECGICGKQFANTLDVKVHIEAVHHKLYPHECKKCSKRFFWRSTLRIHEKRMHEPKPIYLYECDYCHTTFYDKLNLQAHIVRKHLGIKCESCSKPFNTTVLLKRHKSVGCRRCKVCDKAFPNPRKLNYHFMTKHTRRSEQKMFECDYCCKQFLTKGLLTTHMTVHLTPADAFQCHHCDKKFKRRMAIIDHIWDIHMLSLYCHICMKRFYRDCEFQEHQRAGCRLPQLPCEMCNKTFSSAYKLTCHMVSHGSRKFECDTCDSSFKHRTSLVAHMYQEHL